MKTIVTTETRIEQAFIEWYKRALEQPSNFSTDIIDPVEDGKASASYLVELLKTLPATE